MGSVSLRTVLFLQCRGFHSPRAPGSETFKISRIVSAFPVTVVFAASIIRDRSPLGFLASQWSREVEPRARLWPSGYA